MGNPAGRIFERQTKPTFEVKTRHFIETFEGQNQRYSRLTWYLCVFPHGILSICRENLFLSSYMPSSAHFVRNRLLTNYILRLAISMIYKCLVQDVKTACCCISLIGFRKMVGVWIGFLSIILRKLQFHVELSELSWVLKRYYLSMGFRPRQLTKSILFRAFFTFFVPSGNVTFAWHRTGSAMHFKAEADWTV